MAAHVMLRYMINLPLLPVNPPPVIERKILSFELFGILFQS